MRHLLPNPRFLVTLALLALGSAPAWAGPGCPVSFVELNGRRTPTLDAVLDSTSVSARRSLVASFDLRTGTLVAKAEGSAPLESMANTGDEFVAGGLPAGTRITLTIELVTALSASSDPIAAGTASASARLQCQNHESSHLVTDSFQNPVLSLPVTVYAGFPFRVTAEVKATSSQGSASATGVYRFSDLPAGVRVTSCNGYSGIAVAGRALYWGEVKSRYR
jgi:hypothetical protein